MFAEMEQKSDVFSNWSTTIKQSYLIRPERRVVVHDHDRAKCFLLVVPRNIAMSWMSIKIRKESEEILARQPEPICLPIELQHVAP